MFMRTMAIAALAAGVAASSASAEPTYSFRNNTAATGWSGTHEPARSAFDPVTNRLFFEAALACNPGFQFGGYRFEMARFSTAATGGTGQVGGRFATPVRLEPAHSGESDGSGVGTAANSDLLGGLTLSVDAANILGYNPDGADAGSSDSFGFWLHSLRRFDVSNRDRRGPGVGGDHALREFEDSSVNGANLPMNVVPLPSGAAMAALGLVGIATRRRRD